MVTPGILSLGRAVLTSDRDSGKYREVFEFRFKLGWPPVGNTWQILKRKGGRETEKGREGEREKVEREGKREEGRGIGSKDRDRIKL